MESPPPWTRAPPPPSESLCGEEDNLRYLFLAGIVCGMLAASSSSITTPAGRWQSYMMWLVTLTLLGVGAILPFVLSLERCEDFPSGNMMWLIVLSLVGAAFLVYTIRIYRDIGAVQLARLKTIEGDLEARLADGSLRLLRVAWLLGRPAGWVLQRRQDLPAEAFWSPKQAARLLREGRVAALSYRWLTQKHPDPQRFHLDKVLRYFRWRVWRQHVALMIDFAALPQKDPLLFEQGREAYEASRSAAENGVFKAGLYVMSNLYASPRVLVLQQKRMPPELERELYDVYGGMAPNDRIDLIPYAGAKCRSGWCTSESACALLMTAGGGHAYELGVGRATVPWGKLPSEARMDQLFTHKSTRFMGNADRDVVSKGYLDLRKKLEAYDKEAIPWVVKRADDLMTIDRESDDRIFMQRVMVVLSVCVPAALVSFLALILRGVFIVQLFFFLLLCAIVVLVGSVAPSRVLRAHIAAKLGLVKHSSLQHTYALGWCGLLTCCFLGTHPPFKPKVAPAADGGRRRPMEAVPYASTSGAAPPQDAVIVPSCFVPRHVKRRPEDANVEDEESDTISALVCLPICMAILARFARSEKGIILVVTILILIGLIFFIRFIVEKESSKE